MITFNIYTFIQTVNQPSLLSSSLCPCLSLCVFPCACLNCCCCASAYLCLCVSSQSAPYIRWNTETTEVRNQVQEMTNGVDAQTQTISRTKCHPAVIWARSFLTNDSVVGQLPARMAEVVRLLTFSARWKGNQSKCSPDVIQLDFKESLWCLFDN